MDILPRNLSLSAFSYDEGYSRRGPYGEFRVR